MKEPKWPKQTPDFCPINCNASCGPSSPDLTNAPLAKEEQIPIDTLQNLVESLPRGEDTVIASKAGALY